MKKVRMRRIALFLILCFEFFVFSEEPKYTVISSEERIGYLVSRIEKNLQSSDVLDKFREEQKNWVLYKKSHLETLFPDSINNVKMLWGSVLSKEMGDEVLLLNLERIKILELYLLRDAETGTDGSGRFMDYVEELSIIHTQ